jgi:hypothetical protein
MRRRLVIRIAATALLAVAAGGFSASARAQPAGNAATEWNAIAATAIMSTAGQPSHVAPLSLAMVQGAVYDAVNAIDGGHEPYLVAPAADPSYSKEAAAATAAFRVLVGLFPAQQPASSRSTTPHLRACPPGRRRRAGSPSASRRPQRC